MLLLRLEACQRLLHQDGQLAVIKRGLLLSDVLLLCCSLLMGVELAPRGLPAVALRHAGLR